MTPAPCLVPPPRTPRGHATVIGVHGSEGATGWKAFYTRRDLTSPTEAVEWATLPPGAVSGEHRHTRTEEIYLILDGEGEYALNGIRHPVRAGTLALTPPDNTHGLENTGNGVLNWWVIETLTPRTQEVLAGASPSGSNSMPAHIFDLTKTPNIDATRIFSGPLTSVNRAVLKQGDQSFFGDGTHEIAVFLNRGKANIAFPGFDGPLEGPACFLVPAGGEAAVGALSEAELYSVHLRVPQQ
ncbi:Cupin domain-containing protein [Roseibium hamelinense]|uniref:Cupin domain-containing protein n=1 Tax=Roseibium hamelinense TaxID=150831 RepID=A0A562TH35_9HYPH|nr:cupin domain-containing protein [Roseibium hamelinense]MTI46154.1 cupin domain-containing protein [Roseibium hamelinense]TWI92653.1 Cupin domain-containing protein [Roseibium hamelinense]